MPPSGTTLSKLKDYVEARANGLGPIDEHPTPAAPAAPPRSKANTVLKGG